MGLEAKVRGLYGEDTVTKEEIMKLAREAGLIQVSDFGVIGPFPEHIERFAALIAAHKAEVALAEAYRCGYKDGMEAAAVVCENLPMQQDRDVRD